MVLATPAVNAPRLPLKTPSAAPAPPGWTRANASVTAGGGLSRPKFGVVAPALLRALTLAANAVPALIGPALTALKPKLAGALMKVSVPVITRPASLLPALPL